LTICLVINCKYIRNNEEHPCVLFAADTQESGSYVKRTTTKLHRFSGKEPEEGQRRWRIEFAIAGDALVADEAIEEIKFHLYDHIKPNEKMISIALRARRTEIGDIAYKIYEKYKTRGSIHPEFELFIGAANKYAMVLYVNNEGKTRLVGNFGIIGTGGVTGGELLLGEFYREDLTEEEAANLAAMVISAVARVDMFVGGSPDMYVCRKGAVWKYGPKKYSRIIQETESRWQLLKDVWKKTHLDKRIKKELQQILEED